MKSLPIFRCLIFVYESNAHAFLPMRSIIACIAPMLLFVGCQNKSSHERLAVEGKVTLNGKPLEFGSILFVPKGDNPGPKAGGIIHHGSYQILPAEGPVAGELRVKIYSPRFAPDTKLPEDLNQLKQLAAHAGELLPAEYNATTQLTVIAKKDEPNRFDFDLEMASR